MIGCEDEMKTQMAVCCLFNDKYPERGPMSQSSVYKIEISFKCYVRDLPEGSAKPVSINTDFDGKKEG